MECKAINTQSVSFISVLKSTLVFGSECGVFSVFQLPEDIRKPSPKLVESFKIGNKRLIDCQLVKGDQG